MIDVAVERMHQSQNAELRRLQGLARVNPNIRKEEIEHLAKSIETLEHYLRKAQLRLEAIRIMVVV